MGDVEKTGSLYLGKHYDPQKRKALDEPVLYESQDLTTHAICVSMTGSGKTELCIDRLEEAALETIPAIVVDPKGDMTHLLLTFPELRPEEFRAKKADVTVDAFGLAWVPRWRVTCEDKGVARQLFLPAHDKIQEAKDDQRFQTRRS